MSAPPKRVQSMLNFGTKLAAAKRVKGTAKGEEVLTYLASETVEEPPLTSPPQKELIVNRDVGKALVYDPSKEGYDPVRDACWGAGEPVPYFAFAKTLQCLEETSSRLKISQYLGNYYASVISLSRAELEPSIYMTLNQLAPSYMGKELGIGEGVLFSILKDVSGLSVKAIKETYKNDLDLGVLAQKYKSSQVLLLKSSALTLCGVFDKFHLISEMTGNKSVVKKTDEIKKLYTYSKGVETKFLFRALSGKLRIGCSDSTILQALAHAVAMTLDDQRPINKKERLITEDPVAYKERHKELHGIIKKAYLELPHMGRIIEAIYKFPIRDLLHHCSLTAGIPLSPMLANPCRAYSEIFDKFKDGNFTCEYKYDGERAQIHSTSKGDMYIYSRNMENNTQKYPEILHQMQAFVKQTADQGATDFILDAEVVAYDPQTKKILPFQVLTTRKRKNVQSEAISVQVLVYVFDLLYLNGKSLVEKPFIDRRRILAEYFQRVEGVFEFATYLDVTRIIKPGKDKLPLKLATESSNHSFLVEGGLVCESNIADSKFAETITTNPNKMYSETVSEHDIEDKIFLFMEQAVRDNTEGLMVKSLVENATYEIAIRSKSWFKLKKDYLEAVGDTLDLVVVGADYGAGKRKGLFGAFLLASYDTETETYQTICKIGTGLSDAVLQSLYEEFKKEVIPDKRKKSYYQHSGPDPDVWLEATKVLEIKAADFTLSPVYQSAFGEVCPGKGISLRFPRLVRERPDKTPEEATSSLRIADMYRSQASYTGSSAKKGTFNNNNNNYDEDGYSE